MQSTNPPPKTTLTPAEQSQVDHEANFLNESDWMKSKLEEGEHPTEAEANHLRRMEVRAHGYTEKGGITARAQSIAIKDHQAAGGVSPPTSTTAPVNNKVTQTKLADEYHHFADEVKEKLDHGDMPTMNEASHLRSLETKVLGHTEKGGIAAQAQSAASKAGNLAGGTVQYSGPVTPEEQFH